MGRSWRAMKSCLGSSKTRWSYAIVAKLVKSSSHLLHVSLDEGRKVLLVTYVDSTSNDMEPVGVAMEKSMGRDFYTF